MKKFKRKHPIYVSDPRSTKKVRYWLDHNGNDEEHKQMNLEEEIRIKNSKK